MPEPLGVYDHFCGSLVDLIFIDAAVLGITYCCCGGDHDVPSDSDATASLQPHWHGRLVQCCHQKATKKPPHPQDLGTRSPLDCYL